MDKPREFSVLCSECFFPSDPFLGPSDSTSHKTGCSKIGKDERHSIWLENSYVAGTIDRSDSLTIDETRDVVHAIYNSKKKSLHHNNKEWFPISFHSPNVIQTGDGTRWNRDGVATEREKKLQDENQALRDQIELLERQLGIGPKD